MRTARTGTGEVIAGRRVVVTGATQVFGAALVRQVRAQGPASLRAFDDDVRHPQAVDEFFDAEPADVVLHAATFPSRRLAERRPSEAVKTNLQGTEHVVRAALKNGAERIVLVSSDLAAQPESMLGASLRVAELVVARAAEKARKKADRNADKEPGTRGKPIGGAGPVLASVRVGRVLDAGPEGPLTDQVAAQLSAGGVVTLSSPDVVCHLVTADQAAARVLDAARIAVTGGVYEVDMGEPVRVVDLVTQVARDLGLPEPTVRFADPRRGGPSGGVTVSRQRVLTSASHVYSIPGGPDTGKLAELPERLQKVYAAAKKNRDPKVRQQLAKLARS